MLPLSELQVTNACLVACDLDRWEDSGSAAWQVLRGSQDEVGAALGELVSRKGVARLDDFGGVAETFLCEGDAYLDSPRRTVGGAAIYSFTPKNKIALEGLAMARAAKSAGYALLILTVQKEGKFGKTWGLLALSRCLLRPGLVYYEDTAAVIDELKAAPEGARVEAVHVLAPGFEELRSRLSDRVVSQAQYLHEILSPPASGRE